MKFISWQEILSKLYLLPKSVCYGVPKNGMILALLRGNATVHPEQADFILDDIVDSGRTKLQYEKMYPGKPFYSLYHSKDEKDWLHFPWEKLPEEDIEETVVRQLEFIGESVNREGLQQTPERVVKSWNKLFGGYKQKPYEILKPLFKEEYNEMVLMKDIELYSTCEHHLLPFFGKCHIAYIPNGALVGISKLARLMECFARRLQIQERLANEIAHVLDIELKPKGVAVIIEAQHFCMTSRGVEKQKSKMITSALRGVFLDNQSARAELMRLIK